MYFKRLRHICQEDSAYFCGFSGKLPSKRIKGMINMQKYNLPAAGEPDMPARSAEIRMQERHERDRREATL
jgi:hypothetical protein